VKKTLAKYRGMTLDDRRRAGGMDRGNGEEIKVHGPTILNRELLEGKKRELRGGEGG